MFSRVLCVALLVEVYGMPMDHGQHGTGKEEYDIKLYINGGITTWKISSWHSNKTVHDIVKAINEYGKGPKQTLSNPSGYRGYDINHIMNGAVVHTWVLPKCKKPDLEIAILQYTAISSVANQYLADLKTSLSSCPSNGK